MARDPAEMQRYFRECMAPCRELLTPPSFPPVDPAPRMDADDVAAAVAKAVAEALASRSAKEKPVETPKEADTVAETSKTRLSKKDVCRIVRASLLEHHRYNFNQEGEIGNYNPLAAKVIVDQIVAETGAKEGTAKGAVSRAFEFLFSSSRGHTEYVKHCKSRKLLLNWCIRESGDGKAFAVGTLDAGELASESELQSRVEFRE